MSQSKNEKEVEYKYQIRFKILDLLASTIHLLIPWGSIVIIVYLGYNSIGLLAGKSTFADIGIRVLGDFKVSEGIAYIFGLGGIGYGVRQRTVRRNNIESLSKRTRELEEQLDPKRSSSKLTTRGTTRPEDRP